MRLCPPKGGIRIGKGLMRKPALRRESVGCPAKLLFLSDLHLRKGQEQLLQLTLDACEGLTPDALLLGGDLSEYSEGLSLVLSSLRRRFPAIPVFAVEGNNDEPLLNGDEEARAALYTQSGMTLLYNSCGEFTVNGKKLRVAGVRESIFHTPEAEGLFDGAEDAYKILLSHEPLKSLLSCKPNLMLSGHTHGGQINILGITAYTVFYEPNLAFTALAGRVQRGNTTVIVSRGIGTSKFPVRIGADSEIHYLT